jgi:hypothetical protein
MAQTTYRCNKCGYEGKYPINSEVWCPCRPRSKSKMVELSKEVNRIMMKEFKLNKIEQC